VHFLEGFGGAVVVATVVLGGKMEQLAVELKEPTEKAVAQPHCTCNYRLEDRLHISRRAAYDAQNLGCRRLASMSVG
jgi:hypothetical protein